jgi:hypothetical protein
MQAKYLSSLKEAGNIVSAATAGGHDLPAAIEARPALCACGEQYCLSAIMARENDRRPRMMPDAYRRQPALKQRGKPSQLQSATGGMRDYLAALVATQNRELASCFAHGMMPG